TSVSSYRPPITYTVSYSGNAAPQSLTSFPTRRSSDLCGASPTRAPGSCWCWPPPESSASRACHWVEAKTSRPGAPPSWSTPPSRSEEHTSELQSRENLVCRLLLEKKNKKE